MLQIKIHQGQGENQPLRQQKAKLGHWSVRLLLLTALILSGFSQLMAQCALCTKTVQQLGDGPASGLNKGILYLMCIPLGILSVIGYKWYKKEKISQAEDLNN